MPNNFLYPAGFESKDPEHVLAHHGRSFNWAKRFLGREKGIAAARLYQFCRYVDDLADDTENDHIAKLEEIRSTLTKGYIDSTNDYVVEDFLKLTADYDLPILAAIALLDGVIGDQTFSSTSNDAELIRYCYRVAGTVGLLMSPILGNKIDEALPHAIDLGIAMQLTNICRDVLEDAKQGRCYLPIDHKGDLSAKIIKAATAESDPFRETISEHIQYWLNISDAYYSSGLKGLWHLTKSGHCSIYLAAKIYSEIGNKLKRNGISWWEGRVVITPLEKTYVTLKCSHRLMLPFLLNRKMSDVCITKSNHDSTLHEHLTGLPYANC